jgi:hypothetical protein
MALIDAAPDQEVGPSAPDGKLISDGARMTASYTMCWDLTLSGSKRRLQRTSALRRFSPRGQ